MFARGFARGQLPLAATRRVQAKYASTRAAVPVTSAEFYEHFLRCMPPTGWRESIVVANSGGPDSVCLLFLLSSVLREREKRHNYSTSTLPVVRVLSSLPQAREKLLSNRACTFPSMVHSIHLNHGMQSANSRMESIAAGQARRFGISHTTASIPWGTPPFLPLAEGQNAEEFLRKARTALLYKSISRLGARCIAYAHHADDQVETAIMRLTSGSTDRGASGMRPIRRWGMGDPADIHLAGHGGMKTWVIRPLLDIPKDRLIATCEANGLEYVIDPTNFQPEVTLRNAIRDYLGRRETRLPDSATMDDVLAIPQGDKERQIEEAIQNLCPGPSKIVKMREAVRHLGQNLELHEVQATNALQSVMLPSPPSTILLPVDQLQRITEPKTQIAIARRVMRYISPKPWGSLAAIGHARASGEEQFTSRLFGHQSNIVTNSFASGGEVMWQFVALGKQGEIKFRLPKRNEPWLWLGRRMPPCAGQGESLHADLTDELRRALQAKKSSWTYLYDNRFAVKFHLSRKPYFKIKKDICSLLEALERGRIGVRPTTTFYLPEVAWTHDFEENVSLGAYRQSKEAPSPNWHSVPWISVEFVRPLSML